MTTLSDTLYPPIEPFATHYLDVGDNHTLYLEEAGSRTGFPALFVHGGPGGGITASDRQFFDPDLYRIILVDQRGSGRSTPHGELNTNTTQHLIDDFEKVRQYLGIQRWMLFGGSWGSALSLAYAQQHPGQTAGLILRGIFMLRSSERDWFYQNGLKHIQPEEWEQFASIVPVNERDDLLAAYANRLLGDDKNEAQHFALAWARWEGVNSTIKPDLNLIETLTESKMALNMARIMVHYLTHGGFFESEDELLEGVDKIRTVPATIIQGRYDLCCPITTAYDLAKKWPEAQFITIPAAGHSSKEVPVARALIDATNRFANERHARF